MESINSNLGGFESILRDQPNRLASVSELFNSLPDESISEEDLESVSGRSDAGEFNKSLGQGFGLTWEETQALKKLADIAKEMTDGENDDEGKHSNDLLSSLKTKEANKGTPMLSRVNRSKSRGPSFQKAKDIGGRELDFDTSDDDSDNEGNEWAAPKLPFVSLAPATFSLLPRTTPTPATSPFPHRDDDDENDPDL